MIYLNKYRSALLVVIAVSLCVCGCAKKNQQKIAADDTDKIFSARKSDLIIGTLLRGSANAKEKHKLSPEAACKNILTWIEEENARVKKGDVVIKFEKQDLIDDIEDRKLALETLRKKLILEKEEKRILLSENQSDLRSARDAVVSAEESYTRYYKYDGKNDKETLVEAVDSAKNNLKTAEQEYREKSSELSNTIYDDAEAKKKAQEELENLENALDQKRNACENAEYKLRIFKKYTYPNTLTDKKNKLEQSRLDLEKVKIRTESKLIQKENEIRRLENEISKAEDELERLEGYLPLMEIRAPVDGVLIYGDVDRRHNKIKITVGMECGRRRVLATIPEMDNLVVNFELPEQFHYRVKEGDRVVITPDSIPGMKLSGYVSEIAVVPVHQIHWDRSSPKIYNSVVTLDEQNRKFVSGMSVEIEIIEDELKDVLNIPVEAVFEEEGDYFVYMRSGEKFSRQIVELGKSTDKYVHILKGLNAGDEVCLYSPYD
ncbi:MAG: hypothetical protein R6V06_02195 [Kiritimatiellia bacterium]